jgi:L-ascorbate metabolism protein UlaG (beta-lactamase superfamily)
MKRDLLALVVFAAVVGSWWSRERPKSDPATAEHPAGPASAASTTDLATDRFPTAKGDLVVSPLEHASILFGWDGKALYVDPSSLAVADEKLPQADIVLVTEAQYDHLDAVAVERLTRAGTVVVGPPSVAEKVHVDVVVRDGDTRTVHGIVVTAVPLYSVERGPAPGRLYHARGRGEGYVLDFGGTRVYVSGDSECTPEMQALERIDVAFVAVKPPVAMTPGEAARCIDAFRPGVVLPYHDWRVDLSDLERDLRPRGVDLRERDFYPRAAQWRKEATRFCGEGHFGICRDVLDKAKTLDPAGEADQEVVHLREQVRAWQSPFPPWW